MVSTGFGYIRLMNEKRSPRKRYTRHSAPRCKRRWSHAERIAYYSKPDPLSGCHIWHGPLKSGYGRLVCQNRTGYAQYAHRIAWEMNCSRDTCSGPTSHEPKSKLMVSTSMRRMRSRSGAL